MDPERIKRASCPKGSFFFFLRGKLCFRARESQDRSPHHLARTTRIAGHLPLRTSHSERRWRELWEQSIKLNMEFQVTSVVTSSSHFVFEARNWSIVLRILNSQKFTLWRLVQKKCVFIWNRTDKTKTSSASLKSWTMLSGDNFLFRPSASNNLWHC